MDLAALRENGLTSDAIEMFKNADGDPAKVSKDDLTTVIMKSTDLSREEAAGKVDTLVMKYKEVSAKWKVKEEELKAKAEKTADDATHAASTAFNVLFFLLMLGALAAWFVARLENSIKI